MSIANSKSIFDAFRHDNHWGILCRPARGLEAILFSFGAVVSSFEVTSSSTEAQGVSIGAVDR